MNPTGTLTFTRQPDGSLTHEWRGGRRIAIAHILYRQMEGARPNAIGSVVKADSLTLRVVGLGFEAVGSMYRGDVIAMREGPFARFVAWYAQTAYKLADPLFRFESAILRRPLSDGMDIPKWSLTGLMLRPLL